MIKECHRYPDLNHGSCQEPPDAGEKAVAAYFERHGFTVERLCTADSQKTPDFRIRRGSVHALVEVKWLKEAPLGATPTNDLQYRDTQEYRAALREVEHQHQMIIGNADQWLQWTGQFPYPTKRNTSKHEAVLLHKIRQDVDTTIKRQQLSHTDYPFHVVIRRVDTHVWHDHEREQFVDALFRDLTRFRDLLPFCQETSLSGWVWNVGDSTWNKFFSYARANELRVENDVKLQQAPSLIITNEMPHLGPNMEALKQSCRSAQEQIRSYLARTPESENPYRIVVLLMDIDLVYYLFQGYDPTTHTYEFSHLIEKDLNRDLLDITTLLIAEFRELTPEEKKSMNAEQKSRGHETVTDAALKVTHTPITHPWWHHFSRPVINLDDPFHI